MHRHVGQPTNYSLMNEVYEMERIVSIQSKDRQAVTNLMYTPRALFSQLFLKICLFILCLYTICRLVTLPCEITFESPSL